ncbi:hypothetical protein D9M68_18650 [compost metagenome]
MRINVAGVWKAAATFVKVAGAWVRVKKVHIRVAGVWRECLNSVVSFTDIVDILNDVTNWVNDPTRGWYKNTYSWNATNTSKLDAGFIASIRKVSAVFTGYNDTPAGCLGESIIRLDLSDGTFALIGISDGHTVAAQGQAVHYGRPSLGQQYTTTANIITTKLEYVIPDGITVTAVYLGSNGYNNGGTYYPFQTRGMRDFEFTLG